jgi:hypothetical protein
MGLEILQPFPHIGNQLFRLFFTYIHDGCCIYAFRLAPFVLFDSTVCQQDILFAGDQFHQACKDPAVLALPI